MRRLVVGIAALSLLAVTVGFAASGSVEAAPSTTQVYTANAYSYKGGAIFDGAFCVGGVLVSTPKTEQVAGPFTIASGSTEVRFYDSDSVACTDPDPTASATVDLPADGTVTLMAYWGLEERAVVMLVDPLDCVAAGNGRLTVRNGAAIYASGSADIRGAGPDGIDKVLFSDVAPGAQASADLPVGNYTNVRALDSGTSNVKTTIGTVSVTANSGIYEYLYGGNDGEVGSFSDSSDLSTCAVVTTTTSTTAPAAAAPAAVQATPAFTG